MAAKKNPKTAADWDAVIEDLTERAHRAQARADQLEQERQPHRLAAAQGDQKAQAELDRLAEDARQASTELGDLEGALQQARAEREAAAKAERKQADAQRRKDLRHALQRREQAAQKVDTKMAELAEAFEEFHAVGREVRQLGRGDHNLARRANSPSRMAMAAQHHGLHKHIPMERWSARHAKPMAEVDQAFSGAMARDAEELTADKLAT